VQRSTTTHGMSTGSWPSSSAADESIFEPLASQTWGLCPASSAATWTRLGCSDGNRFAVVLSIRPASGSHKVGPCGTGSPLCRAGKCLGPPKHLRSEAVQRVLSACDRSTVKGKRDYVILLLLARLGLRAGEIVALQLDDIDWTNGDLVVRSKKGNGWARLPLPMDVGRALERYLMVRPPTPTETSLSEDTPRSRRSRHQVPFPFW
jgi:Arc/MetJ family transcription regulator